MTQSVISIDSIILNSISTDSSAGKALEDFFRGNFLGKHSVGLLIDPHSGRDAVSLSEHHCRRQGALYFFTHWLVAFDQWGLKISCGIHLLL